MKLIFALILSAWSLEASAYDAKTLKAMASVQTELSRCMGYFIIVRECVGAQNPKLAEDSRRTSQLLATRAVKMGIEIGMSNEAIQQKLLVLQKEQHVLMKFSCGNIKSVYDVNAGRCVRVVLHEDEVLKDYLNQ